MSESSDTFVVTPRLLPRDVWDWLTLLGELVCGGFLCLTLTLPMPSPLPYSGVQWLVLAVLSVIPIVAFLVFVALHASLKMRLAPEGIWCSPFLGSPQRVPWGEVSNVELAPRDEVILHGLLWPPWASVTRQAHWMSVYSRCYRFTCRERYFYCGPKDVEAFEAAVNRFAPGLLTSAEDVPI